MARPTLIALTKSASLIAEPVRTGRDMYFPARICWKKLCLGSRGAHVVRKLVERPDIAEVTVETLGMAHHNRDFPVVARNIVNAVICKLPGRSQYSNKFHW